jgi:Flp pilus assembly protein TadB
MLSNHERRELARIEQGLRDDPSWREPRGLPEGTTWWHRWGLRLLIAFSGLVMTIGVITTAGELLLQGVLMMGAACAWWLCRQAAAARAESQSQSQSPDLPPER